MTNKLPLFLLPIFLSLACIAPTALPVSPTTPAPTNTPREILQFASPTYVTTIPPKEKQAVCLVVIADESLHLRKEPTEHSQALAWLKNGIELTGFVSADGWWFVRWDKGIDETLYGYVKSEFVEECK